MKSRRRCSSIDAYGVYRELVSARSSLLSGTNSIFGTVRVNIENRHLRAARFALALLPLMGLSAVAAVAILWIGRDRASLAVGPDKAAVTPAIS